MVDKPDFLEKTGIRCKKGRFYNECINKKAYLIAFILLIMGFGILCITYYFISGDSIYAFAEISTIISGILISTAFIFFLNEVIRKRTNTTL